MGEKYKGDEKKIEKVFVQNFKNNLSSNLKEFDEYYFELANLLVNK